MTAGRSLHRHNRHGCRQRRRPLRTGLLTLALVPLIGAPTWGGEGPAGESYSLDGHTAPLTALAFFPDGNQVASLSRDETLRLWDLQRRRMIRTIHVRGPMRLEAGDLAVSPDGRLVAVALSHALSVYDLTGRRLFRFDSPDDVEITQVAFLPDGERLVTPFQPGGVRIWEAATGRPLQTLTPQDAAGASAARTLAVTPDGRVFVADQGGQVAVWDLDAEKRTVLLETGQAGPAAFELENDRLVVAGRAGITTSQVRVFDLANGKLLRQWDDVPGRVSSVHWLPGGQRFLTTTFDGRIRIRDLRMARPMATFSIGASGMSTAAVAGPLLVAAGAFPPGSEPQYSRGATHFGLHVWRLPAESFDTAAPSTGAPSTGAPSTGALSDGPPGELFTLPGHDKPILAVAFTPDGRHAVSVDAAGGLYYWDLARRRLVRHITAPAEQSMVHEVALSPDGRYAAVAGSRTVILYDLLAGEMMHHLEPIGTEDRAVSVAFSPDGRRVAAPLERNGLGVWEVASGRLVHKFGSPDPSYGAAVPELAIAADGRVFTLEGRTICVFDPARKTQRDLARISVMAWRGAFDLESGRLLVHDMRAGQLVLIDIGTGKELRRYDGLDGWTMSIIWLPGKRRFLASGRDETARIWSVETGEIVYTFPAEQHGVIGWAVSPDGRHAISGSQVIQRNQRRDEPEAEQAHRLHVWRLPALDGHVEAAEKGVPAVAERRPRPGREIPRTPLPDGPPGELFQLPGHEEGIKALAFAPDGRHVLSASEDATIRYWDLKERTARLLYRGDPRTIGAQCLSVSPDGRTAAAGFFQRVVLYDLAGDAPPRVLAMDDGPTYKQVAFSPDGRLLVSGASGHLIVWDVATGEPVRQLGEAWRGRRGIPRKLAFAGPDTLLASDSGAAFVEWDVHGERLPPPVLYPVEHFDVDRTTNRLVTSYMSEIRLYDLDTRALRRRISPLEGVGSADPRRTVPPTVEWVAGVALVPGSERFITSMRDGTLRVWSADSAEPLHVFEPSTPNGSRLAVSPDGRFAVTSGRAASRPDAQSEGKDGSGMKGHIVLRVWRLPR